MPAANSSIDLKLQGGGRSGRGGTYLGVCARLFACCAVGLTGAACAEESPSIDSARYAIAEPGPWHIPPETIAIGETQYTTYTGAGPWVGESGCGGGMLEGTGILREYIYQYFPQAYQIGGYSCRPIVGNESQMSVHATGRALDIMIETVGGEADNSAGDPIGNWLIENSEYIGMQYIIWNRWQWNASRDAPKDREYTGEHPHHDHLHVELTPQAANLGTPFFQNPMMPPDVASCGTIPAEGGVVDDTDTCAANYGPAQYWRAVDGVGHGGSLLWTNAFQGDGPSNWGRWILDVAAAGRYRAEIYLVPQYAVFNSVRYEIKHGDAADVVTVDQSAADTEGWYTLGAFDFAAGAGQSVSLFDNSKDAVAEEQHIVFDALRLTPCSGDDCDGTPPGGGGGGDGGGGGGGEDDSGSSFVSGGCAAGGSTGGPVWALILLALLWHRRRR